MSECKRCGHKWEPKGPQEWGTPFLPQVVNTAGWTPKNCPKCKSSRWNQTKRNTRKAGGEQP